MQEFRGFCAMADTQAGSFFINSEQVGDFVTVTMPPSGGEDGEAIRVHYLEAGVGEPLLLIHGIGSRSTPGATSLRS